MHNVRRVAGSVSRNPVLPLAQGLCAAHGLNHVPIAAINHIPRPAEHLVRRLHKKIHYANTHARFQWTTGWAMIFSKIVLPLFHFQLRVTWKDKSRCENIAVHRSMTKSNNEQTSVPPQAGQLFTDVYFLQPPCIDVPCVFQDLRRVIQTRTKWIGFSDGHE